MLPGRTGVAVAFLYGLAAICFLISVFNTATANVVFILSFNTMFAALLSWLVLGERPARFTVIIMIVMIGGVLLIVGDGIHSGRYLGDLMALTVAFLLAVIITVSRANGKDMGFAPMIGGILPALIALAVLLKTGTGMASVGQPWWLILNGAVVIPVSFWCLATGPKYITGPEVAMFYLLETVLAPIWVWMVFGETPTILALIGGTVIIVSSIGGLKGHGKLVHSAWLFQRDRQRQLPRPVNRPRT